MPDPSPDTRVTAEPITAVLAERVRALRAAAGLSQEELAVRLKDHGITWKRTAVVNLEKHAPGSRGAASTGRDAVTVQEWLALAHVLGVPPIALLTDPRHSDVVPVDPPKSVDPWTAYYWISGLAHPGLHKGSWSYTSNVLRLGVLHLEICDEIGELPAFRPRQTAADRAALDEQDRARFAALLDVRRDLVRSGAALPVVHPRVARRAAELDVDLDVTESVGEEG